MIFRNFLRNVNVIGLHLIFVILIANHCSSTKPVSGTVNNVPNEIPAKKELSDSVSPLLKTEPILAKVKERENDFSWRTIPDSQTYEAIRKIPFSEKGKEQIRNILADKRISSPVRFLYLRKLVSFSLLEKNYSQAADVYAKYKSDFPEKSKDINTLISILKENEGNVALLDSGKLVNEFESYGPVLELSGRKMYFTSPSATGGKGGEDILEVTWDGMNWTNRKFLQELNSETHDSALSASADGTELYIFGNYKNSLGGGDIFKSKLTKTGWSLPENLGRPINSVDFDSDAFPTPDGKALLFVSDRAGGYYAQKKKGQFWAGDTWGNTDIYISFKKEDGTFAAPINLGPMINTPGAERTPFLHPDGKTLYFSSNGYNVGFGNLDLYKSVRLDDTWTNWSEPIHLGKTLNTIAADWGFVMTASSDKGYMSGISKDGSKNNIYTIVPLPTRAKPDSLVTGIQGRVIDEQGNPIEAEIEWEDLGSGNTLGKLNSKSNTGEFFITLPNGKNYGYFVSKDGYFSQSQNIDLTKEKSYRVQEIEIVLVSIKNAASSGKEINLNNILFKSDSSELDDRSHAELDRFSNLLKENPSIKIEIQGHTSTSNRPEAFNLELSQKRAQSVADYLLQKGIEADRIRVKGYGSSKPVVPNTTEENKKKNRRVNFIVVE
jgi:outer membrane protein OmpA-like peptidoglycan-associated protein